MECMHTQTESGIILSSRVEGCHPLQPRGDQVADTPAGLVTHPIGKWNQHRLTPGNHSPTYLIMSFLLPSSLASLPGQDPHKSKQHLRTGQPSSGSPLTTCMACFGLLVLQLPINNVKVHATQTSKYQITC